MERPAPYDGVMKKLWKVLVVLALGLTVDVPAPTTGSGLSVQLNGPGLAIVLYGILAMITLTSVLNHLPGVFALRRPLGVVLSGYEYLWAPAMFTVLVGFNWTGVIEGRDPDSSYWTLVYGQVNGLYLCAGAFGAFAVLMWLLKLRASMIEANRGLE